MVKVTGYSYRGVVLAAVETLGGEVRYIVEHTGECARMIHIFNGSQLRRDVAFYNMGFTNDQ